MDNKEIKKEFGTIREIKEIIKEKQIKNEIRKNQIKHKKEELNLQLNAIIKEINEINNTINKQYSDYIENNNVCSDDIFLKLKQIEIILKEKQQYVKEKDREIKEREKQLKEKVEKLPKEKIELYTKLLNNKNNGKQYIHRLQNNNYAYEKMKNNLHINSIFNDVFTECGLNMDTINNKKLPQKVM